MALENNWTYFQKIVVLTTPKNVNRIDKLKENFKLAGITNYQIIENEAVGNKKYANDGLPNSTLWDLLKSNSNICNDVCKSITNSHIQQIKSANAATSILIFEDDVEFDLNFNFLLLNKIVQWLKTNDWDLFYFGQFPYPNPIVIPVTLFGICRIFKNITAHAYALNATGIQKVLSYIDNLPQLENIDNILYNFDGKKYAIIPSLCYQNIPPATYKMFMNKIGLPLVNFRNICIVCNSLSLCFFYFLIFLIIYALNYFRRY